MLRLTEIEDVLFGYPQLPPFLQPQIHTQLSTVASMVHTSKALADGFPLFLNFMINIERLSSSLEASVLLIMPVIPDRNAFCTIEYLAPLKFNMSHSCFTGPVTHTNLVLLTCTKSQHILTTDSLAKCYTDDPAFVCPTNVLQFASNITWLCFPFNPDTKLSVLRHHIPANDCANLHPLIHLGGRMFLSTTTMDLQLSQGHLVTAPLAVYRFPCNESFSGVAVGLGPCPKRLSVCSDDLCLRPPVYSMGCR